MHATTVPRDHTQPMSSDSPPPVFKPNGVFPTPETRAAMLAMYDAKLATWPVPYEEIDLPTTFGSAHVVIAGRKTAPPVLMFHMAACSSFIWQPIIAPLALCRRVYAVDSIGDVNKSVLDDSRDYPKNGAALAAWVCEVADGLHLECSDVIAGSYGGWLGMHYAMHAPERVRRLVLLVPMGLPNWLQTIRVLVRLATIPIGLTPSRMERTLSYLMGDDPKPRALAGDWFREVFTRKCRMKMAGPTSISCERLRAIRAPTLIILGGRDQLVGSAERAAHRAKSSIANVEIDIVASGTHAVHADEPTHVSARIVGFLDGTSGKS